MYGTSKYRARDMGVSRNFCLYGSKTCHVLSPQLKDETTTIGESPTSQAHDFLVRFCENITWLGVWTHGIPGQLPHWPVIDDESSFWIWKDKLLEVRVMFRSWCWVSGDRSATFLHVSLVIRIFTMFIGARLSATAVLYPNNHLQQFIHYPHMSISKVWIYRLLFVCLFFVYLYGYGFLHRGISFVRRFIGVQSNESPIFVNFLPPEAQNQTNRRVRGPLLLACKHYRHALTLDMRRS